MQTVEFEKIFIQQLSQFRAVEEGQISCLLPIKNSLQMLYPTIDFSNVKFVFEMIPLLRAHNLLGSVYSVNKKIKEFEVLTYRQEDIDLCIVQNKAKK